jgi:hypothetical protein
VFFTLALPFLAKYIAPMAMFIAGIGIAIFLPSLKLRSWFGMVTGGCMGVAGSVVGHAAAVFAVTFWYGQLGITITPRDEYRRAFAFEPGAEVTQTRGRRSFSIQTTRQFLRFHAPPHTIATLVRGRFDRSSADDCRRRFQTSRQYAPAWWAPIAAPRMECWVAEPFHQYPPDAAWLLYDPVTGQAHFQHVAINTDMPEPDSPIQHVDV